MELKEIVTVSGKGGLFKVVKPTRTGMILESLDTQKTRFIAGPQHRLSLLSEISVYTNTADGNTPLQEVLNTLHETYGNQPLPVSGRSETQELVTFMEKAVPDYDRSRVYASDIKKLVTWYGILQEYAPEILEKKAEEQTTETSPAEPVAEEKPRKTKKPSAEDAAEEVTQPAAKKKQKA